MAIENRTTIDASIDANINTNGANEISALDVRTQLKKITESYANKDDDSNLLNIRSYISSGRVYKVGEGCFFNNVTYICIVQTGNKAFDTNDWIEEQSIKSGIRQVVADITARDALTGLRTNDLIEVTDASADANITTGWAVYKYNGTGFDLRFSQDGLTGGSGSGDMTKAVYDTDDDGKVNAAVVADSANSVDYSNIQNAPSLTQLHDQNTDTGTNSNSFTIGDGVAGDKNIIIINDGSANPPFLKWDNTISRLQLANDGVNLRNIALDAIVTGTQNTAFVEKYGDDSAGELGNPGKPYLTIQAALDAKPTNTIVIRVGFGTYDEEIVDTGTGINGDKDILLILSPGTVITNSGTGSTLQTNTGAAVADRRIFKVYGNGGGKLTRTGTGTSSLVNLTSIIKGLEEVSNVNGSIYPANNDFTIQDVELVKSDNAIALTLYRNNTLKNIGTIQSDGGIAVNLANQYGFGNGIIIEDIDVIRSTSSYAIQGSSPGANDRLYINNIGCIESTVTTAIRIPALPFLGNCEVYSSANVATAHAIQFFTGTNTSATRLENVRMITTGAGALAISNTKGAYTIELNNTLRNTGLEADITDVLANARDIQNASLTSRFSII